MVGDCGIHFRADDARQVELGITLAPAYQGKGLAAEALGCVLTYVFGPLGKHRAMAVTDAENHAAARLFRTWGSGRRPTSSSTCGSRGRGAASMSSLCCNGNGKPGEPEPALEAPRGTCAFEAPFNSS